MVKRILLLILALLLIAVVLFVLKIHLADPEGAERLGELPVPLAIANDRQACGGSWIGQNQHGLWEVYLKGDALTRGVEFGVLAKELVHRQEDLFIERIRTMIPNEGKLNMLKYLVAWFDRDIEKHVTLEYQQEIFGVSRSFSNAYDHMAPKYYRALNYHAAHDIGHAMQDLAHVGCTSFAAWGNRTVDHELIVARNFDFYMGDEFAKDRIVLFIDPEEGHPFVSITWGGMMGVVSGMNMEGLTVTINAAKSELPTSGRTPISLLAREIVQYASTIDEAIAIAERREVFVSESIMVGSAKDGTAAIIEKAPNNMGVFRSNSNTLVCANHYQSNAFSKDERNLESIKSSDSMARSKRMQLLLDQHESLDPSVAISILRDKENDVNGPPGLGDPDQLAQLIAHHGVVFQPKDKLVFVATFPYQIGAFVKYDLNEVFKKSAVEILPNCIHEEEGTIPADPFLFTEEFNKFEVFKKKNEALLMQMNKGTPPNMSPSEIDAFVSLDPNSYRGYRTVGDLLAAQGNCAGAVIWLQKALEHGPASQAETENIKERIKLCSSSSDQ